MQKIINKQSNLFIRYEGDNIHDNISSVNYLWDDMESMIFDASILDDFEKMCSGKHIYLFMEYGIPYPISFKTKHFGFWEEIRRKYKLLISNTEQISYPGKYCEIYLGLCELGICDVNIITQFIGGASFLIISGVKHTLNDYKPYIQINNSEVKIKISSIINDFCAIGEKIVTVIRGCDGSSLNVFYKKYS